VAQQTQLVDLAVRVTTAATADLPATRAALEPGAILAQAAIPLLRVMVAVVVAVGMQVPVKAVVAAAA
jgi:hypothetical protein